MHRETETIGGAKDGEGEADGAAGIELKVLRGAAVTALLPELARLRIEVFREFPYLYDGDFDYERQYLASYAAADGAIVVAAYDDGKLVGAATGAPLSGEKGAWTRPLIERGYPVEEVFYFGESVLSSAYRGRGLGHRFFDLREEAARSLGMKYSAFVSVLREDDHPARPEGHRALESFWRKRGYEEVEDAIAEFEWREIGDSVETTHQLQYWARAL